MMVVVPCSFGRREFLLLLVLLIIIVIPVGVACSDRAMMGGLMVGERSGRTFLVDRST